MNPFENTLRDIITVAMSLKDKNAIEIALALIPLVTGITTLAKQVGGWPRDELIAQIKGALDNIIGDEADAIIGPSGSVVVCDVPYVGIEPLTDIIFATIEKALAEDAPA